MIKSKKMSYNIWPNRHDVQLMKCHYVSEVRPPCFFAKACFSLGSIHCIASAILLYIVLHRNKRWLRKTKISHLGTKIICYFYALFAFNLAAAAILPCTYILRSFFKMGAKNASLFLFVCAKLCTKHVHYGIMGCRFSNVGIQNYINFWPNTNILIL